MKTGLLKIAYSDPVYGEVEINDPVILDLLESSAMRRLKGVLQSGISGLIGLRTATTRFDHSLGTMILVRKLGGQLEEQAAALLHDVSHPAFSHVIDYVYGQHDSQNFHEQHKAWWVEQSDLPHILNVHGLDWRVIIDEERFPLLEQPLPRLCADRLDYFFRDSLFVGINTAEEIRSKIERLMTWKGRIVAADPDTARWLGYRFIQTDESCWSNLREVGLYELTARAIQRGLETGAIRERDLWTTDREVWAKLSGSADSELRKRLSLVSMETKFTIDESTPTFRLRPKVRSIDPEVILDGRILPLSKLDPQFDQARKKYLRQKQGNGRLRCYRLLMKINMKYY
jgi:uncharacterized protein